MTADDFTFTGLLAERLSYDELSLLRAKFNSGLEMARTIRGTSDYQSDVWLAMSGLVAELTLCSAATYRAIQKALL